MLQHLDPLVHLKLFALISLKEEEEEKKGSNEDPTPYGVIKEISSTSFQLILLTLKFYDKL